MHGQVKAFDPAPSTSVGPRVAVIGAGVSGLSTAVHLVNQSVHDVVVLEAAHPASGTSGRSVGMVETQLLEEADIAARVYARRFVESLHAEHGLTWTRSGYLRLARDQADVAEFETSVQRQQALGVDDAALLSPAEIGRRWPDLVMSDRAGGLFGAGDGYLDGHEYCDLLTRLVRSCGVEVRLNSRLVAAEQDGSGTWTLHTTRGTIRADHVVNAAGPWAGEVGRLLGAAVPLEPQLHGAVVVNLGRSRAGLVPFVTDRSVERPHEALFFRLEGDSTLLVGLHDERPGHHASRPDTSLGSRPPAEVDRVIELLAGRLRTLDHASVGMSWSGLYPVIPDHQPMVGRHPDNDTVVCALGGGGSGIQLAPAMGALAAAAITRTPAPVTGVEALWNPGRFLPLGTPA